MIKIRSEKHLCEVCSAELTPRPNGKFIRTCSKECHTKLRISNTAKTMRESGIYDRLGKEHKVRMQDPAIKEKHSSGISNALNTTDKNGILRKVKAAKSLSITLRNNPDIHKRREPKRRATMEQSGRWVAICDLPAATAYRLKVHSITMSQPLHLLEHFEKRGPSTSLPSDNHHIDHIFSVMDGFHNNVPPEIIGHISNLRMLHHSENVRKNGKSDITIDELYSRYNQR